MRDHHVQPPDGPYASPSSMAHPTSLAFLTENVIAPIVHQQASSPSPSSSPSSSPKPSSEAPTWDNLLPLFLLGIYFYAGVVGFSLFRITIRFCLSKLSSSATYNPAFASFASSSKYMDRSVHHRKAANIWHGDKNQRKAPLATSSPLNAQSDLGEVLRESETIHGADTALPRKTTWPRWTFDRSHAKWRDRILSDLYVNRPRKRANNLYKRNRFLIAVILFSMSSTMTGLYIAGTYMVFLPTWLKIYQIVLGVLLFIDLLVRMIIAESPIRFVLSFQTFFECLAFTSGIFAHGIQSVNFSYLSSFAAFSHYRDIEARLFVKFRPKRLLVIRLIMRALVTVVMLTSSIMLIEVLGPLFGSGGSSFDDLWNFRAEWVWLNSFYFTVVTLGTVGYGDFFPQTQLGKAFDIITIVIGVITLGSILSEISEMTKSEENTGEFSRTPGMHHVVLCGQSMTLGMVGGFIEEFFADVRNEDFHVVVLAEQPKWTLSQWYSLVARNPTHQYRTHYLHGDIKKEANFLRVEGAFASAFFVFSSVGELNRIRSDAYALLLVMRIRDQNPNVPIFSCIMLMDSILQMVSASSRLIVPDDAESLLRFLEKHNAVRGADHALWNAKKEDLYALTRMNNDVVCLQEFQNALMAESIHCNGLSTLIGDLLSFQNKQHMVSQDSCPPWSLEYTMGSCCYLMSFQIPDEWDNMHLFDLLMPLHDAGIMPIGVRRNVLQPIEIVSTDDTLHANHFLLAITYIKPSHIRKVVGNVKRYFTDHLAPPQATTIHINIAKTSSWNDKADGDFVMEAVKEQEQDKGNGNDKDTNEKLEKSQEPPKASKILGIVDGNPWAPPGSAGIDDGENSPKSKVGNVEDKPKSPEAVTEDAAIQAGYEIEPKSILRRQQAPSVAIKATTPSLPAGIGDADESIKAIESVPSPDRDDQSEDIFVHLDSVHELTPTNSMDIAAMEVNALRPDETGTRKGTSNVQGPEPRSSSQKSVMFEGMNPRSGSGKRSVAFVSDEHLSLSRRAADLDEEDPKSLSKKSVSFAAANLKSLTHDLSSKRSRRLSEHSMSSEGSTRGTSAFSRIKSFCPPSRRVVLRDIESLFELLPELRIDGENPEGARMPHSHSAESEQHLSRKNISEIGIKNHIIVWVGSEEAFMDFNAFLYHLWKFQDHDDRVQVVLVYSETIAALPVKYLHVHGLEILQGAATSPATWIRASINRCNAIVLIGGSRMYSSSATDASTVFSLLTIDTLTTETSNIFVITELLDDSSMPFLSMSLHPRRRSARLGKPMDGSLFASLEDDNEQSDLLSPTDAYRRSQAKMTSPRVERERTDSWNHSNSGLANHSAGELVARGMVNTLLIRSMQEPGLAPFVLSVIGLRDSASFTSSRFTKTQSAIAPTKAPTNVAAAIQDVSSPLITLVQVPETWWQRDKDHSYRSLFLYMIHHGCIPIGLYRSGRGAICIPRLDRSRRDTFERRSDADFRYLTRATNWLKERLYYMYPSTRRNMRANQVTRKRYDAKRHTFRFRTRSIVQSSSDIHDGDAAAHDAEGHASPSRFKTWVSVERDATWSYRSAPASSFMDEGRNSIEYDRFSSSMNILPYVLTFPEPYTDVSMHDGVYILVKQN